MQHMEDFKELRDRYQDQISLPCQEVDKYVGFDMAYAEKISASSSKP